MPETWKVTSTIEALVWSGSDVRVHGGSAV